MRSLAISLGSLTFALVAGCATDSDTATATDDDPGIDVAPESTVLDTCATSCAYNATESVSLGQPHDSYTRTNAQINACQVANPSGYRPTTIAQVNIGSNDANMITARVNAWSVPGGKAGCLASILAMRIETGAGTDVCGLQQIFYQEKHPTWVSGVCQPAEIDYPASASAGTYTVRAVAIRGVEADHLGYETVEIKASSTHLH